MGALADTHLMYYASWGHLLLMTTPRPFKPSHNTLHQLAPAPTCSQLEGWNIIKLAAYFCEPALREEQALCAVRRDFGDMRGHVLTPKNFTCVRKNFPTPFLSLSPDPVSMCPEALLGRYFSCRSSSCIIMASLWRQRTGDYICYIVLFVSPSALAEPLLFFLCHLLSTREC